MSRELRELESKIVKPRKLDRPPLERWNPPLSGDIDIRIARDGRWFHEDTEIRRAPLVRLFASILRREEDDEYYLVTPVEKWRIRVDAHPLLITDVSVAAAGAPPTLTATLNTGEEYAIGEDHPLFLDAAVENVAAIRLPHGLTAICTRPAWYRLIDLAEETGEGDLILSSGPYRFRLSA